MSAPVRAKKHLGQHFLKDEHIAAQIAESIVIPDGVKSLLEIGPGMGMLTKYLLNIPDVHLKVIEIDHESVAYIKEHYPALRNDIIEKDFLQADPYFFGHEPYVVTGNFPYNISTQILFSILDHRDLIPAMVGMFQKEVAERIASPPGNRDYGILSVLLQPWYDIEILFQVDEHHFNPPPRVKSAVLRMTRNNRKSLASDEKVFKHVVKTAFNQRRKTLRNALQALFPGKTDLPYAALRAEQLTWQQFEELALLLM